MCSVLRIAARARIQFGEPDVGFQVSSLGLGGLVDERFSSMAFCSSMWAAAAWL